MATPTKPKMIERLRELGVEADETDTSKHLAALLKDAQQKPTKEVERPQLRSPAPLAGPAPDPVTSSPLPDVDLEAVVRDLDERVDAPKEKPRVFVASLISERLPDARRRRHDVFAGW